MQSRSLMLALTFVLTLPSLASAQESLDVTFTSSPAGGGYAPRNVLAVWIESEAGAFIKTLGRWSNRRTRYLVAWNSASGGDADAVSGATRSNHNTAMNVTWDFKDRAGQVVPNGNYVVRMEVADRNSSSAAQNNQGSFTFAKNGTPGTATDSGGGFSGVTIVYSVTDIDLCGNNTIDPGEACDPPGSCPTSCEPSADACVDVTMVGSADTCTAECSEQAVSACLNDDGCCPAACDEASDNDCAAGGGGGGGGGGTDDGNPDPDPGLSPVTGGCTSGGDKSSMFVLLLLGLAVLRRRRIV